mgnify:CR=1 FL=1
MVRRSGKGIFRGGSGRPCGAFFQFWARSKNCVRTQFKFRALPFLTPCARSFCSVGMQFSGNRRRVIYIYIISNRRSVSVVWRYRRLSSDNAEERGCGKRHTTGKLGYGGNTSPSGGDRCIVAKVGGICEAIGSSP